MKRGINMENADIRTALEEMNQTIISFRRSL